MMVEMVFIDFLLLADYNKLLTDIERSKDIEKHAQTRLKNIVLALREACSKLKQIETQIEGYHEHEGKMWDDFKRLQGERLSLLNLSYNWNTVWSTELEGKPDDLVQRVGNAINELVNYITVFDDALKAHIDILELKNSREDREVMRKLTYMALLVSVAFPYVTLWERFVLDSLLVISFPFGLSPYVNWIIATAVLVPLFWTLKKGWRYLSMAQ